jgi:uncharacterized OsmC-like protein
MTEKTVQIALKQANDYRFTVDFSPVASTLVTDEPAPLGTGLGPDPVQLLLAAVGNCLSDSLLFAFRKFKQAPEPLRCVVSGDVGRNADKMLRVLSIKAQLHLGVNADQLSQTQRVLDQFEKYCTVTQSINLGIPVQVEVFEASGKQLK